MSHRRRAVPGSQKVFINDRRPSFPFCSLPASRRTREGHTPWVPSRHPRFCTQVLGSAAIAAGGPGPAPTWALDPWDWQTRTQGSPGAWQASSTPAQRTPAPARVCSGRPRAQGGRVLCGLCGFGVVGGSVGQILVMGSSYLQHHGAGSTQSRRAASSPIPGRGLLAAALMAVPLAAPPRGLPRVSGGT